MQYTLVKSQFETAVHQPVVFGWSLGLAYLQGRSSTVHYLGAHPDKECGDGLIIQLQLHRKNGGRN